MEEITAAVEDDRLDTGRHGARGQELADGDRGFLVAAALERLATQLLVNARRGREGSPRGVVDDLGVDVLRGAEYREPRPRRAAARDAPTDARTAPVEEGFWLCRHR